MSFLELSEPRALALWKVAFASSQVWERAAARVKPWLLSSVSSVYYLSVAIVLFGFCTLCGANKKCIHG